MHPIQSSTGFVDVTLQSSPLPTVKPPEQDAGSSCRYGKGKIPLASVSPGALCSPLETSLRRTRPSSSPAFLSSSLTLVTMTGSVARKTSDQNCSSRGAHSGAGAGCMCFRSRSQAFKLCLLSTDATCVRCHLRWHHVKRGAAAREVFCTGQVTRTRTTKKRHPQVHHGAKAHNGGAAAGGRMHAGRGMNGTPDDFDPPSRKLAAHPCVR